MSNMEESEMVETLILASVVKDGLPKDANEREQRIIRASELANVLKTFQFAKQA
jgi:hypothetical protein